MVSKKRLYYGGFDGFRAPVIPKAPRSLRRNSHKKSSESSEICPFELLAAVAGQLLQESESSASSTGPEGKEQISIPKDSVKQEPLDVKLKPLRLEYLDQGSCAESGFVHKNSNPELKIEPLLTDLPQSDNDSGLEHASVVTTSDFLKEVCTNVKLEASDGKHGVDDPLSHGELCDVNMDTNRAELPTEAVEKQSEDLTAVKTCSFRDTVKSSVNHGVLNKSYSSVHVPLYSDPVPSACFPKHKGNVKIDIRDDDENSFSCNHHSTKMRAFRFQSRAGYRRIRKILTSKYWKAAPKLKDYELSNPTSGGVNPFDNNRKSMYMRKYCQAEAASNKRRKLFHHNSLKSDYIQDASSESISNLHQTRASGNKKRSPSASNRARGMTSSVINHKGSFQSKDGNVKLCIKSFKVPELYVEMPETSTVGSLKRTIMEAVTAILGGELHVGVLVQGKKVDDNRTLQQTGISLNSDTLGFMLEPSVPEASQSSVQEEHPLSLPCDTHPSPARGPATPIMDLGFSNSLGDSPPPATSLENQVEINQESKPLPVPVPVPVPDEVSTEEIVVDSKALVPIPPMNVEALSIVPLNHKQIKRSELSQRRTRRPFSVSEVEALVEAVETLGTGRWRDVKIRAFDDANHRTYVDLKDKWKTLVHTASISPQQRRGEPVPQDLLDRVLLAHGFWSQNQSKQHGKHQSERVGSPVKVCLEIES